MESYIPTIAASLIALIIGFVIAKIIEKNSASQALNSAKRAAESLIKDAKTEAESLKKEKILQAKEKFIELKAEHEKVILSRDKKMAEAEKRIRDKESQVSNTLAQQKKLNASLEKERTELEEKFKFLEKKEGEVERLHKSQIEQLEVISSLSAEDAKAQLIESLKGEAKTDAMAYIQNSLEEAKMTAQQEAKKIIINTIQRIGTEEAVENCVSVFNLENDDVKGRIIGQNKNKISEIPDNLTYSVRRIKLIKIPILRGFL